MTFNLNRFVLPAILACLFVTHPASHAQSQPQLRTQSPATLSSEERSRIWLEDMQKRRREEKEASEKALRDVLEKIKRLVETDDFSIETVEKTFGLKLEKDQVLDSPKKPLMGPITNYVAVKAEFPFNTTCLQKNFNLRESIDPNYFWYQTADYVKSSEKYFALMLHFKYWDFSDTNFEEVTKKVLTPPEWRVKYSIPHHSDPVPSWSRATNQRDYACFNSRCRQPLRRH